VQVQHGIPGSQQAPGVRRKSGFPKGDGSGTRINRETPDGTVRLIQMRPHARRVLSGIATGVNKKTVDGQRDQMARSPIDDIREIPVARRKLKPLDGKNLSRHMIPKPVDIGESPRIVP
jgi:hypothetical protein